MIEFASTAIRARIDCNLPANEGFLDFLGQIEPLTVFSGGQVVDPDDVYFTLIPDESRRLRELDFTDADIREIANDTLELATNKRGSEPLHLNTRKPFKITGEAEDQLALRIEPRGWLVAARAAVQGYYSELYGETPQSLQDNPYVLLGTVGKPTGFNKIHSDLQHPIARRIPLPLIMEIGDFEVR